MTSDSSYDVGGDGEDDVVDEWRCFRVDNCVSRMCTRTCISSHRKYQYVVYEMTTESEVLLTSRGTR